MMPKIILTLLGAVTVGTCWFAVWHLFKIAKKVQSSRVQDTLLFLCCWALIFTAVGTGVILNRTITLWGS